MECYNCNSREPELEAEDEGVLDLYHGLKTWGFNKIIFDMFEFSLDAITLHKLNAIDSVVKERESKLPEGEGA